MQISCVNYKKLDQGTRLDAEYYRPEFLEVEKLLRKANCKPLDDVSRSIKSFGAYALCNEMVLVDKGIPFIRCKDIKEGFVDFSDVLFIDDKTHHLLSKSAVTPEIVMLTMSGTVGNCAVVDPSWKYPINSNQDIAKIETNELINPYYLTVFLNGKYGKSQTERLPIGSIQQHIFIWQLKGLLILIASNDFQNTIAKLYTKAIKALSDSEAFYKKAKDTLLDDLGLLDWKPKHRLSFVKKYSDTQSSGRIDAEYFQPMYDEILKVVKEYHYGFEPTSTLLKQNRSGFKNKPDELYQYVEIGSVNTSSGEIDPLSLSGKELPANAKIKLNNGDLIISKVRTYRGAVAIVQHDGFVGSGAFTVLRESEKINKETAYVYFKSAPLLKLSLKYNAGTSYPVIDDNDILNLPFPLIPQKTQENIKNKIVEMYHTKILSKRLLDIAKRGVEMAIEKSEKDAQNWIETELKKLNIRLD